MERSEIRDSIDPARSFADFAALHPGYLLTSKFKLVETPIVDGGTKSKAFAGSVVGK
jgi:hypothetical protein